MTLTNLKYFLSLRNLSYELLILIDSNKRLTFIALILFSLKIVKQRLDRFDAAPKYNYWLEHDCEYVERAKINETKSSKEAIIIKRLFNVKSFADLKDIKSMIV